MSEAMIKATEIRLGNLILKEGVIYQIASINSDETIRLKCDDENNPNYSLGTIGCYHLLSITPIELTEDILVKCGFEKKDGEMWCEFHEEFEFVYKYYGLGLCIYWNNEARKFLDDHLEEYECELKYLHQLQNLVFALTGTELEINLQSQKK